MKIKESLLGYKGPLLKAKMAPALIIFFFSSFLLYWGWQIGLRVYDEGISVYGAVRVLNGDIPYRDFRAIYPPGQLYLLAMLFRIFGPSLAVERLYNVVMLSGVATLSFCLAQKFTPKIYAMIAWFFTTLWMATFGFILSGGPGPTAMFFSLSSCLFFCIFLQDRKRRSLMMAGLGTGITFLFRHDTGAYTLFTETLVLISFMLLEPSEGSWSKERFKHIALAYAVFLGAAALPVAPVVLALLHYVPSEYLIADFIKMPQIYRNFRSIPFPMPINDISDLIAGRQTLTSYLMVALNRFIYFYPPLVFLLISILLIASLRYRLRWTAQRWAALLLVLLGFTFYHYVITRMDVPHMFMPTVMGMILLPWILTDTKDNTERKSYAFLRALTLGISLIMILSLGHYFFLSLPTTKGLTALTLGPARGIYLAPSQAKQLEQAVKFVQARVPRKEKIFVGNLRHDRLSINDIAFYFLSERDSATHYYHFDPGVTTTREIQRRIISEIEKNEVNCVVLWMGDENQIEARAQNSGVTDLDDFIRSRFKLVQRYGDYLILLRRL